MTLRHFLCVGDAPITGGAILPYPPLNHTMDIHGVPVAIIGGKVRCDACKSIGIITKTGGSRRCGFFDGVALDGDVCLCKCKTPPPIKAMHALTTWHDDQHQDYADATPLPDYDEQFRLENEEGKFFENFKYRLTFADGSIVVGTTDDYGRTERIETTQPKSIQKVEIFSHANKCCSLYAAGKSMGSYLYQPTAGSMITTPTNIGTSLIPVILKRRGRSLTSGEINMARTIFKDSIDYAKVKVHHGSYIIGQNKDTAMTPNGEMYFPAHTYEEDFSLGSQGFFIHEMTHVWQYQQGYGVKRNGLIIAAHGGYNGSLPPAYIYMPYINSRVDFANFNMEQQGDIIRDFFEGTTRNNSRILYILSRFLKNPNDATLLPQTTDF